MKVAFVIIFAITLVGLVLFEISKLRNFQFWGGLIDHFETDEKIVALTFDDAVNPRSSEVIEILSKAQIKATFYVIGEQALKFPEDMKKLVISGNEIGNHSLTHQRMILKNLDFIQTEIDKTNLILKDAGYGGKITFRPPYGKKLLLLPYYLKKIGMSTVMWNIEPDSENLKTVESYVEYVVNKVKPGSIILIHPFCESDCEIGRQALPIIIQRIKDSGYKFVTISEGMKL